MAFKHGGWGSCLHSDRLCPQTPAGARSPPRVTAPPYEHTHAHGHAGERRGRGAWGVKAARELPSPTASGCREGGEEARPTGNGPRFKSRIITVIIKIKGRRERTHSSKENGKKGSGGGEVPRGSCARHPPHNCGWGLRPPPASPRSPFGEPGHRASPPHRTSLGLSPRARPRAQARARTRRTPSPPHRVHTRGPRPRPPHRAWERRQGNQWEKQS